MKSKNDHSQKDNELLRTAKVHSEWAEKLFSYDLWIIDPDDKKNPTDDEKYYNRLVAFENVLSASAALFKLNDIPIPKPFHAMRLDLYEAIRRRKTEYFISENRNNLSMPMMGLRINLTVAVELLNQAGEGTVDECYKIVAQKLKKNGLDLAKITDREPAYEVIKDWRKSIKSRKAKTGTQQYLRAVYDGYTKIYGLKDTNSEILKRDAEKLITDSAGLFPMISKKV